MALRKERNSETRELEEALKTLSENNQESSEEFIMKKEQLENIRSKTIEGVLIRPKTRWIGEGEKTSQYFCNQGKRHYTSKRMTSLIKDNGIKTNDNDEKVNEVRTFYELLYKSRDGTLEDVIAYLLTHLADDTSKLSDEEAQTMEGKITYEEAGTVLNNRNNKSQGSDRYTFEFFKFFWKDLGHYLIRAINFNLELKLISTTQREGLITCIPKREK